VLGWPASYRPQSIYGQIEGSNDLVNQRLCGEVNLDDFEVSHTKDSIQFMGDEEEEVEKGLKEACADYRLVAKTRRKRGDDERRPSDLEVTTAVDQFQEELSWDEIVDALTEEAIPPTDVVEAGFKPLFEGVDLAAPDFQADMHVIQVLGFLNYDASANDPYVAIESTDNYTVQVIINMQHPHIRQLYGSEGVLNYLRHCTYDAIAEWQARHKAQLDPDTIKWLKDRLLRMSVQFEMVGPALDPSGGE
jgi:hypothetical protein